MERRSLCLCLCVLISAVYGALGRDVGSDAGFRAITRPSADITLSFVQIGRIEEVLFADGDKVAAGQVVARLDDAADQVQLAQLEAQSKDTTQIKASEASLEQKRVDLQKLEKAAVHQAVTPLEVQHARLDVTIAELSLDLARLEHQQAVLKFDEAKIRVQHMRLASPIDGIVESVHVEKGESVNALDEVVRIVQIDPLWIDASVPVPTALSLKPDQSVRVVFSGPKANQSQGRITYLSSVADAASGTLIVRIEVPNPQTRPAGEQVQVFFDAP